jgi:hypothetical protein
MPQRVIGLTFMNEKRRELSRPCHPMSVQIHHIEALVEGISSKTSIDIVLCVPSNDEPHVADTLLLFSYIDRGERAWHFILEDGTGKRDP